VENKPVQKVSHEVDIEIHLNRAACCLDTKIETAISAPSVNLLREFLTGAFFGGFGYQTPEDFGHQVKQQRRPSGSLAAPRTTGGPNLVAIFNPWRQRGGRDVMCRPTILCKF